MLYPIAEEPPEIEMEDTGGDSPKQAFDVDEGVMAAASRCMKYHVGSLYSILTRSPEVLQALNATLHEHHGVTLAGFIDDNGGKYILFFQVNEPLSVRRCELDMHVYSLRQTLEWVLNECEGSIQWALDSWVRDFEPIWNQRQLLSWHRALPRGHG